jgi:hypothetical protein
MPGQEAVGFLHDDAPYLKIGQGPPLVMVPGVTPEHDVPRGWQRRMALASARALARDFTVYVVNRKRGLQPGESMSNIAGIWPTRSSTTLASRCSWRAPAPAGRSHCSLPSSGLTSCPED